MKKETLISQKIPHESAIKHVSGAAYYTDDIPEPPGTLYLSLIHISEPTRPY